MAAFGSPTIAGRGIARYLTNSLCNRSAPSRSIRRIRKTSGSGLANPGRATAFPLATESISQPMAARRGRTLVWKNRSAFRGSSLIREAATLSSSLCPARCGATRPTAVFIKQPMAARLGSKFSRARIFRLVVRILQWIRPVPTSCSPRCGISGAKAGSTAPAAKVPRRLQRAGCFARRMAAIHGRKLRLGPTKVSRKNHMAGLQWLSRLRTRNAFTPLLNRPIARCSSPMTAARHGTSATKASGWCGVRSTLRISLSIRKILIACSRLTAR